MFCQYLNIILRFLTMLKVYIAHVEIILNIFSMSDPTTYRLHCGLNAIIINKLRSVC